MMKKTKSKKQSKMKVRAIVVLVFSLSVLSACGKGDDFSLLSEASTTEQAGDVLPGALPTGEAELANTGEQSDAEANAEETPIFVQVCGAVVAPGIYSMPSGSRIFEAVERAGGMLPTADLSSLNQAKPLEDGQMVYVFTQGEMAAEPERAGEQVGATDGKGSKADGLVNINTASKADLMGLPGIGEAKAEIIVSFREENGAFSAIEDLMKITGIKEGVFSKIKDKIKV
ncbi:ComE operon protein 1 [Clostridia bacterium]|nr:ComE operon protein 1 [Clostridia bacterium]